MSHCDSQQNNTNLVVNQATSGSVSIFERNGSVVCPTARRVGISTNSPKLPLICQLSKQVESMDEKARRELDIILKKKGSVAGQLLTPLDSAPPFCSGSPPSRTSNPLIKDVHFRDGVIISPFPVPPPPGLSPSSSAANIGGCIKMKFEYKPAAIRVEGFDCISREHQHSNVHAAA
ncbi:uncharacterized protein LOC127803126 [Diospyros lotus]|uniref:uncharacterized protein LOC127803126 n=1 Tax=Diospyros lotus TaxID=55363 RepID=UPI00225296EB|nr:uncharacterized protein LOC127803126 [Diospyros lotus]